MVTTATTTSSAPDSTSLTLRFKHGRLTLLLLTSPLTPLPALLKELLSALHERYPRGLPSPTPEKEAYTPIPASGLDVVLGVPRDPFDREKGWKELGLNGNGRELKETPTSLGWKEGAVIAFAFVGDEKEKEKEKGEERFWVESSNVEELYPEED